MRATALGPGWATYRPIAAGAVSAFCQRRNDEPSAQVEWVPLEIRSGKQFAHGSVGDPRGVEHQAVGRVVVHVGGQRHQIAVVLACAADARRHRRLAAVDAVVEREPLLGAGLQVVLDQPVEQEPAGLARRGVGVAVVEARIAGVDHAELGDAVGELLFGGGAGDQVEPPAAQPGLQPVEGEEAECLLATYPP